MGFFSWKKSDDNQPVWNKWSDRGPTPCKMIDDQGNSWVELSYGGYGVFAGMDYYLLACKMNDLDTDRDDGIRLAFDDGIEIKRPKIVSVTCDVPWADLPDSEIDDNQGFFEW